MANIVLFEDEFSAHMYPITLTRPAAFVQVGSYCLADLAMLTGASVQLSCRSYLQAIASRRLALGAGIKGQSNFYLNASIVPDTALVAWMQSAITADDAFVVLTGERLAAAFVPAGHKLASQLPDDLAPETASLTLRDLSLPVCESMQLPMLEYPFHAVAAHKDLCLPSLEFRLARGGYTRYAAAGCEGNYGVWVGQGVKIAPLVSFHCNDGPVILDDGVQVLDFSFFRGPVYLGPKTRVIEHAAIKDNVCSGHTCKIGGEVECSVIDDYSNKQHHGFLGHSWIGSWVNLGAGTSNSDLKNTYGAIQINHGDRRLNTGMQFFGCVMGDYSKTAINTSIFTGKIIGVNAMLYGYVGQNVASFTNYAQSFNQITECTIAQAISTQKRMYARRNVDQMPADIIFLQDLFAMTAAERRLSNNPLVL